RSLAATEDCVDRVARRSGRFRDDHALLAEDRVQQARLADIRAAEYGYSDRVLPYFLAGSSRETGHDHVEQVARVEPVRGRDRDRVAEAEPVELERVRLLRRVVDLVREQEDRLVRVPQYGGELLVARRDPCARVDDEEDEIGLGDGRPRLIRD